MNNQRRIFTLNEPNAPRINPLLAEEIGLNESLILLQIEFWISISNNYRDGRYWTYQSIRDIQKTFSFWSKDTINRAIKNLTGGTEKNPKPCLLIEGNHNSRKYDKTRWFALNFEELKKLKSIAVNGGTEEEKEEEKKGNDSEEKEKEGGVATRSTQNETRSTQNETRSTQNETTIPETTTETTTENFYDPSDRGNEIDIYQQTMNKHINDLIDVFWQEVKHLQSNQSWFGRAVFRKSAQAIIEAYGAEDAIKIARLAVKIQGRPYAPVIDNPQKLQIKMRQLENYIKREEEKENNIVIGTDFSQEE